MLTKNVRIAVGAVLAIAVIAVLAISTTGSNSGGGSMPGMDHSSMNSDASSASTTASASASDVDAAFVRQMIPHHQMAVEMAKIASQNAKHSEIKTLAAAIIAAQNKEITQLRSIASDDGVDLKDASNQMTADAKTLGLAMNEMGMSMDMHGFAEADPFDRAFIDGMIPHHEGAIAMANAELKSGGNSQLKEIAKAIITAQNKEIAEMKQWRADWYSGDAPAATTGGGSSMEDMPGM